MTRLTKAFKHLEHTSQATYFNTSFKPDVPFPPLALLSITSCRPSLLHSLYRAPLDFVEQVSTGMAHRVLVNSAFTAGVFASTFSRLAAAGVVPQVSVITYASPGAPVGGALGTFESQTSHRLMRCLITHRWSGL